MRAGFAFLLLTLALAVTPAAAVQPDEVLPDPAQEARARELSKELRCMVCQNQSIDDSDAPLARDLRLLVRERIQDGDSDREVMDYLVARYGEFVLLRPTWHGANAILWLAPFAVLVFGGIGLFVAYRRRAAQAGSADAPAVAPLSPEEEARLRVALGGTASPEGPADVTKL
ncbi:cytochrome c-type biogenesis protein CcmH [Ancylobacter dichloromethanicus]|uniref:Cytochrome c-type biogenesis protein n=2 Tax=Ancylobacter dichloromethanicus TaxID=518825 RepID=A0A9W6MXH9_9HYPH|nr:cytochrome c-type biogenesis protein [Ancylobacter dichloromethanicus]GLK69925.1 cytochrome c-type biogenesis protein CcmH [Ancylobacter dichloromethanicus]